MTISRTLLLAMAAVLVAGAPAPDPRALIEMGHFRQARGMVEERFRAHPDDPETMWLMARIKLIWGERESALALAQKAVSADPKNARYRLCLAEVLGDMAQKASLLEKLSLATRFRKEIEATIAINPGNVQALRHLLEFHLRAPSVAGGDLAKAKALADNIMRIDRVQGFFALARIARHEKQDQRLTEIYSEAVRAQPESYDARVALSRQYNSPAVRNYQQAEDHARAAIGLDPRRASAYSELAIALAGQGKWMPLEHALAKAQTSVPDNATPHYRAAMLCLETGKDLPRAEKYFRGYLTLEPLPFAPTRAQAHWRLGQTLEKQNRKPEAVAEYRAAIQLDPASQAKNDLERLR